MQYLSISLETLDTVNQTSSAVGLEHRIQGQGWLNQTKPNSVQANPF